MSVGISFCLADRSVCDFLCFVGLMSSFLMRSNFLNMFATRWQYLANIWCNVQGIGVKCLCLRGDFVLFWFESCVCLCANCLELLDHVGNGWRGLGSGVVGRI